MSKLLIQGRFSTFKNSKGEKNIPIERKRDIREDASWYSRIEGDTILPILTHEQYEDIRYEHDSISHIPITHNDIIRKQHGEHTDPIVDAYLNAEYRYEINNEIRKKYKKIGWIENVLTPDSRTDSYPYQPARLVRRKPYKDMSNDELLEIMFLPFKLYAKEYSDELEKNFKKNDGGLTLEHHLKKWAVRDKTNLDNLLDSLKSKIMIAYQGGMTQDVSDEIQKNMINFSSAWSMLPELMAFGGIQEVELKGYLSKVKHKGKGAQFDKFGKVHYDTTILEVKLDFIIKDWFGVDEEDVYKVTKATQLGRGALVAFWVLQHQRGFRPFINKITYTETKDYIF